MKTATLRPKDKVLVGGVEVEVVDVLPGRQGGRVVLHFKTDKHVLVVNFPEKRNNSK